MLQILQMKFLLPTFHFFPFSSGTSNSLFLKNEMCMIVTVNTCKIVDKTLLPLEGIQESHFLQLVLHQYQSSVLKL